MLRFFGRKPRWALCGVLLLGLFAGLSVAAQQDGPINVEQRVDPQEIVVRGTGSPDVTTVTLALKTPEIQGRPIDLVLALDRSASVALEEVQGTAHAFVEHLSADDRVGIVSFADVAQVELELTEDLEQAEEAIDGLTPGKQTALGDGLMLAIDHILNNARSEAFSLIVAPTDGVHNTGADPLEQAERAGNEEIPIFAIAISPAARVWMLDGIAQRSGGSFFARFSEDALERIFDAGGRRVAARYILITQTLPQTAVFVKALEHPPSVLPGRDATQLQWRIPVLFRGEIWTTRYQIGARQEGTFNLNQRPSTIEYSDAQGRSLAVQLPTSTSIHVVRGPETPEEPERPEQPEEPEEPEEPQQPEQPSDSAPKAKLAFSPESPLMGEAVVFDASGSSDPDGEIVKYEWDWTNDGTFDFESDQATAIHPYGRAGEFTVRLRVTDNEGATAEATASVSVIEGLKAGAAVTGVSSAFAGDPTIPDWMSYYIDDGLVTDEEVRDANARFAADVFIPGTQYRLKAEDATAIVQINQLAELVEKYNDVGVAEEDGYVKVGPFVPQVGQAYVKESFLKEPPIFDRPPVLLYGRDAEGNLKLAGVRFISTDENARLFQITGWADHPASAHYDDGSEQAASSIDNVRSEKNGAKLLFWHPTLYGLHVWVGMINPNGLFAARHPKVTQSQ